VALHPYGHTRAKITTFVYDATFLTTTTTFGKGLICTEVGYPGNGMSYRDTVGFCRYDPAPWPVRLRGVPRPDLNPAPNTEEGIGFMCWAFMIGYVDTTTGFVSKMPHFIGTGLFYHDGTIRDLVAVEAFIELARLQGIPATALWKTPGNPTGIGTGLVVKTSGPDYVDPRLGPNIGPDLDDYTTLNAILTAPPYFWQSPWWSTPTWTWDDYEQVAKLLRVVAGFANTADFASTGNGNPITATPRPPEHPVFGSNWLVAGDLWPVFPNAQSPGTTYTQALTRFTKESTPGLPEHDAMLVDLEGKYPTLPGLLGISSSPGWLQPGVPGPNQDVFVTIIVEEFLQQFALMLNPLIVPRGGPF
jgi:hypothetical protein